jgi:polysaccharide biosynthesis protein PslH
LKKILYLTHIFPYPPNEGGRIATYNLLKELSNYGHKITLCSFISSEELSNKFHEKLDVNLHQMELIKKDYSNPISKIIKNLFSDKAYTTEKYIDNKYTNKILQIVEKQNIDIVYCDHLHTAYYGQLLSQRFPKLTIVLREHNVESQILNRAADTEKNLFKKLFLSLQATKLKKYEVNIINTINKVFMISEDDRNYMSKLTSNKNLSILQAGVDTTRYFPVEYGENEKLNLLFLGTMSWLPNIEGVIWFLDNVFPEIIRLNPNTVFYIAGKNPPEKLQEYKKKFGEKIEITGFVEDEREYINRADVFLVPLRIGSGIRIKILIALAMRKIIITTKIGIEGINIHKDSAFIADNENEFINSFKQIIDNRYEAEKKAKLGYEEIMGKYSNEVIYHKHAEELDDLA